MTTLRIVSLCISGIAIIISVISMILCWRWRNDP